MARTKNLNWFSRHDVVFIEKRYYNIFAPFRAGSVTMSMHFTGHSHEITSLRYASTRMQHTCKRWRLKTANGLPHWETRTNVIVLRNPIERFKSAHVLAKNTFSGEQPVIVSHFWPVYRYLTNIPCKIIPYDMISYYVSRDYNPFTSYLTKNKLPDAHYPSWFKKEVEAFNYLYDNREIITPEEFKKIC